MKGLRRLFISVTIAFILFSGAVPGPAQIRHAPERLPLPPPPSLADDHLPFEDGTSINHDSADGFSILSPMEAVSTRERYEEATEGDYAEPMPTGAMTHTIRKGDTLGSISRQYFGTTQKWKEIASFNGINNPASLKVGRIIKIPGNVGKPTTKRRRAVYQPIELPPVDYSPAQVRYAPVDNLPRVEEMNYYSADAVPLPSVGGGSDILLYQEKGLPKIILPELGKKEDTSRNNVTLDGLTGMTRTFAAYPLGKGVFSTSLGMIWNKITRRDGNRLKVGEDGDYYQFPIALTYAAENFETALVLPFESYDIYAPLTYNFRDGSDSGMGDAALRLKFSSQNENMASCLGIGAIFPTNDRVIGTTENDNSWEVFGGVSTKRTEGGNLHLNVGYQASNGNTAHEGVFANVGFDYKANDSFNFMGEVNSYNRVNDGRSTDLTLGMRYFVKPGMTFTLSAPIALNNDMFFGYDYRIQGQMQYHY